MYGAWRTFARNRLAMAGLAIVAALVVIAIFAEALAPYSPYVGDLRTTRLLPPSAVYRFDLEVAERGRELEGARRDLEAGGSALRRRG